jgi:FkbM family methyltransferase
MSYREYVRHRLIGTPLDRPARLVRDMFTRRILIRHPEISDALLEDRLLHKIIHAKVRAESNCIDVGGHLGAVTQLFVELAPKGNHTCVEPTPHKAGWLRKKYPQVQLFQGAVSDHTGTISFFHQPKNSGYSGLGKQVTDENSLEGVEELRVPCSTVDAIVGDALKIDFIKIDVEGAELLVLRGASKVIARGRPTIIFECTKPGTDSLGISPADVYALLTRDYAMRIFTPRGFLEGKPPISQEEFLAAMHFPFKAFSFVATPAEA